MVRSEEFDKPSPFTADTIVSATRTAAREYESLGAMEADPGTPVCEAIWQPIHGLAEAGTFGAAIWTDPQRRIWFER